MYCITLQHYRSPGPGVQLQEVKSFDLGETWSIPRSLSFLHKEGPPVQPGQSPSFWASPGAALQLSANNPFHPGRLIFTGRMNSCGVFWYTDDGENYHLSKNASGSTVPFCQPAIAETALAETPEGGVLTSSRNGVFHGPDKCNCRAVLHSLDGGSTFGQLTFDPVLVEPECMATMINGGSPGGIFHANPGHGTAKESKSPPNGRATGTVRRSMDGGKTWTSGAGGGCRVAEGGVQIRLRGFRVGCGDGMGVSTHKAISTPHHLSFSLTHSLTHSSTH